MTELVIRRSDKTRAALQSAFTRLVFEHGFENVSVRGIVEATGVARSTFYEHFSSREDMLAAVFAPFLTPIADCVASDAIPPNLVKVVEHLWENRRLTDAIFSGAAGLVLARSLTDAVERTLRSICGDRPVDVPLRLAAIQIAEGQLALVEAWLRGRAYCPAEPLAKALHRTARASSTALIGA